MPMTKILPGANLKYPLKVLWLYCTQSRMSSLSTVMSDKQLMQSSFNISTTKSHQSLRGWMGPRTHGELSYFLLRNAHPACGYQRWVWQQHICLSCLPKIRQRLFRFTEIFEMRLYVT
jgi:hypothetical protein